MNEILPQEHHSLRFVRNLLSNMPTVLRMRIDLDDILTAIGTRLDQEDAAIFIKDVSGLIGSALNLSTSHDIDEVEENIASIVMNGRGALEWRRLNALISRHKDLALVLIKAIDCIIKSRPSMASDEFSYGLDNIASNLQLSRLERDLLALMYLSSEHLGIFADAFKEDRIWETKEQIGVAAAALGITLSEAKSLLGSDGRLFRFGLLRRRSANSAVDIPENIGKFLSGNSASRDFIETIFEFEGVDRPMYRPPNVTDEDWEITTTLVKERNPVHILLHGAPGAGKSMLAKAIASHLGLRVINVMTPQDGDQEDRITNLMCAAAISGNRDDLVVLIDEADRLLMTRNSYFFYGDKKDKGWLNKFLENARVRAIWITNDVSNIEASTLRRFAYKIEFKSLTRGQRRSVWENVIAEVPMLKEHLSVEEIKDFADRFPLQPAEIAESVRHVTSLGLAPDRTRSLLERCLESHLQMKGERAKPSAKVGAIAPYSIAGLNTNRKLDDVVDAVSRFLHAPVDGVRNLNVLLSGPPGTGKTEFVRYLAEATGFDLIVKSASDLKNPYVGVTEKKIAAAFEEAENDGAILFIDEADSFIWPREDAHQSWEVSWTNEFLCRMEAFSGVLICATNAVGRLDSAAYRRFAYRVGFEPLSPDGCVEFYKRFFGRYGECCSLDQVSEARVRALRIMTPGDFKAAMQRLAFVAVEDIDTARVIQELEDECRFKSQNGGGHTIGFQPDEA